LRSQEEVGRLLPICSHRNDEWGCRFGDNRRGLQASDFDNPGRRRNQQRSQPSAGPLRLARPAGAVEHGAACWSGPWAGLAFTVIPDVPVRLRGMGVDPVRSARRSGPGVVG